MEQYTTPVPVHEDLAGGVGSEIDRRPITPSTKVALSLRYLVVVIGGIVTIVLGGAGGYYALASTDTALGVRVDNATKKAEQIERRLDAAVTKADLKSLRLKMRMDMINAVWECARGSGRSFMICRLRPVGGYGQEDSDP